MHTNNSGKKLLLLTHGSICGPRVCKYECRKREGDHTFLCLSLPYVTWLFIWVKYKLSTERLASIPGKCLINNIGIKCKEPTNVCALHLHIHMSIPFDEYNLVYYSVKNKTAVGFY